ncbi:hypothetical protein DSM112329_04567 [Paraconexibacter sp. AEG42_29]|uniref:PASTA domain-containing protein n=1 Tax=Paraconexibacter sp. AEG42_29 TaxID=2997339 RepID=A0AAU7B190_9ACTN
MTSSLPRTPRTTRRSLAVAATTLLATVAAAAAAPGAHAETRYTTPFSSATTAPGVAGACTPSAPCQINAAFAAAQPGDTIHVAAGDYGSADAPLTRSLVPGGLAANVTIHFEDGVRLDLAPTGKGPGLAVPTGARVHGNGVQLRFRGDGYGVANFGGAVERMEVRSSDGPSCVARGAGARFTSTLCLNTRATLGYGFVSTAEAVEVDHLTAVVTGDYSSAILVDSRGGSAYDSDSPARLTMRSSIGWAFDAASRVSAGLYFATDGNRSATATVVRSIVSSHGAQGPGPWALDDQGMRGADPRPVGTGDWHLKAGSPAIDAGDDAPGTTNTRDLVGNPRVSGAASDIGAYEFDPRHPGSAAVGGGGAAPVLTPGSVTPPAPATTTTGTGTPSEPAFTPGSVAAPVPATTTTSTTSGPVLTAPYTSTAAPTVTRRCVVPRVVNLTLAAARHRLTKAGCAVGRVGELRRLSNGTLVVQRQSIAAKQRRAAGTRVSLGRL